MVANFSVLELGHIEVALEAYIEDAIDTRTHWDEANVTAEERAEIDAIVMEGRALLEKVQGLLK